MTRAETITPRITRSCGDCAMCCKIPIIPELEKPFNTWCVNCSTRGSCDIYDTRPERCRDYFCYFVASDLGEEWRPSKCRFMITTTAEHVLVMADPARPDAWRKEPYFAAIRKWSETIQVQVLLNGDTHIVFPDHIDNIGEVTDQHQIMTIEERAGNGMRRYAKRVLKSEIEAELARLNTPIHTTGSI